MGMGEDCILFSYLLGLLPFAYGFYVMCVRRVYLYSWSRVPIVGPKAVWLGLLCILFSVLYYAVIIWAWSTYDH
jgi:hypothetical protein